MKEHVKAEEWSDGGFSLQRYVRCRCGWKAQHYSRQLLNEVFKAHQKQEGGLVNETAGQAFGAVKQDLNTRKKGVRRRVTPPRHPPDELVHVTLGWTQQADRDDARGVRFFLEDENHLAIGFLYLSRADLADALASHANVPALWRQYRRG